MSDVTEKPEVFVHAANPNLLYVKGSKHYTMHECEGGMQALQTKHAAYIVKCVNEREALTAERDALREKEKYLIENLEYLGEMSDICTKDYTGKICNTCRCRHNQQGE